MGVALYTISLHINKFFSSDIEIVGYELINDIYKNNNGDVWKRYACYYCVKSFNKPNTKQEKKKKEVLGMVIVQNQFCSSECRKVSLNKHRNIKNKYLIKNF